MHGNMCMEYIQYYHGTTVMNALFVECLRALIATICRFFSLFFLRFAQVRRPGRLADRQVHDVAFPHTSRGRRCAGGPSWSEGAPPCGNGCTRTHVSSAAATTAEDVHPLLSGARARRPAATTLTSARSRSPAATFFSQ